MDRRAFIKNMLKTSMVLGINGSLEFASGNQRGIGYRGDMPSYSEYNWKTTIFCQFDNESLKDYIEVCALDIGCKVYHGEMGSPDIIAIPYFVALVDLNSMDTYTWENYVDFCHEADDNTPLIICGDFDSSVFKLPDTKFHETFHAIDPYEITKRLKDIKSHVDKTS